MSHEVSKDTGAYVVSKDRDASNDTGWRRLGGSPKLQIIFHKRATRYRALLLKMTYKDKGSYESWPPCIYMDDGGHDTRLIRDMTHSSVTEMSHVSDQVSWYEDECVVTCLMRV